jgi:hypothetical protein
MQSILINFLISGLPLERPKSHSTEGLKKLVAAAQK